MKSIVCVFVVFVSALLCGCSFWGSDETTDISAIGVKPASPVTEPTHDELAESTKALLEAADQSKQIMNELAGQDNAPKEGIKAAEKVNKKYEDRLSELEDMEFSDLTDEELYDISEELSSIISDVREARDLLQGI